MRSVALYYRHFVAFFAYAMARASRYRCFVFTHWCDWENDDAGHPELDMSRLRYYSYQLEVAPDPDGEKEHMGMHFQGYAEFKNPVTYRTAVQLLDASWVQHRLTDGAQPYTQKTETRVDGPWEWGQMITQGERMDWGALDAMVQEGATEKMIEEKFPTMYTRYHGGIGKRVRLHARVRGNDERPTVVVFQGRSGSGKTMNAKNWLRGKGGYSKVTLSGEGFWNGYDESKPGVLFDEFDKKPLSLSVLLDVMDYGNTVVNVKGASANASFMYMCLTCNSDISTWYPKQDWTPILRRLSRYYVYQPETGTFIDELPVFLSSYGSQIATAVAPAPLDLP